MVKLIICFPTKRYLNGFVILLILLPTLAVTTTVEFNLEDNSNGYLVSESPVINSTTWAAVFGVRELNTTMTQTSVVNLTIIYIDPSWGEDYEFHVLSSDPELVTINRIITADNISKDTTSWTGNVTIDARFLGHTTAYVELRRPNAAPERSTENLDISVMRNIGIFDTLFQVCIGGFVMILYINFGAALDLNSLKNIMLRPIGPLIGFVSQFLCMPVLSFFIGYILFRDMIELRLGLFFTGATPGGGASNIFTVLLDGNLNLSITMTTISNLAAFGMMPLWIFTLGALIFQDGNFAIPYNTIAAMSFSLVIPLSIGIALQKYAPDISKKMSKLLKPIALVFIIFITVFAFTVNSYIFKLFTWKIIVASCALPWIGYFIGWVLAILLGQSSQDALTIAIETGIQNTGIAIFMLNFTLPQPQADMTSAVPIASSMMTPLPLLTIYIIRKLFFRTHVEEVERSKELNEIEVETIRKKETTNHVQPPQEQQETELLAQR